MVYKSVRKWLQDIVDQRSEYECCDNALMRSLGFKDKRTGTMYYINVSIVYDCKGTDGLPIEVYQDLSTQEGRKEMAKTLSGLGFHHKYGQWPDRCPFETMTKPMANLV